MAKDEYTFTFLKGTASATGAGSAGAKPQAGDAAFKNLAKYLERILKDSSKESSAKLAKSLESILTKFARVQPQAQGTAASAGMSRADASRIAKEVSSEVINQQIKQLVKAFPSQTTTKSSDVKIIQAIEKSADRQAKTLIGGLNSILSRQGIQLEDTKNLERAVSGAIKSAIPKDAGTGIKEIGRTVALLRSGISDINKIAKSMGAMRQSGGGIDVKEIEKMMRSFQQLNQKYKQVIDSTTRTGKAIESVTKDISGFKKIASDLKQVVSTKVTGVRQKAEADPAKFAKTTAMAVGQALEKALRKSPSFKGSELERSVKKLDEGVKNIGDVLNKFNKIQSDITTSVKTGQISIDTKAIGDLSKTIGKLPQTIGTDVGTKGWKDLSKGLENFSKTATVIANSLKNLKVEAGVDTKQIETKIETAVRSGVKKGFGDVKFAMKGVDVAFDKVINEMRNMYKGLPKDSPLKPQVEKTGTLLKAAKEKGDYSAIAQRVTKMRDSLNPEGLNKAIEELRGSIVEFTSELKGAGIDNVERVFKEIASEVGSTKLDQKIKKSGRAVDELASTVDKKRKEIASFDSSKLSPVKAMDKVKFLQKTAKTFPQEFIQPGQPFELKGTEMGFGADVRKAVKEKADSLSMSLRNLEKDLIAGLQAGQGFQKFGWKLLDKQLENVGQQWTLQIAQIGGPKGIESLLKQLDKTYVKIEDPKVLLQEYERKRKQKITDTTKQRTVQADKVGKWLTQRDSKDIEELSSENLISKTTESTLKEVKSKYKGTEVGEKMRKELVDRLGDSLNNVFKETFAADQVKRELTSGDKPLLRRVALPAAQISKTGTAIFKTRYGTERALPKFATYRTGFEELYDKMNEQQAMVGEEYRKFQNDIIDIGMKPAGDTLPLAKTTSKDMLSRMSKAGPQQLEFVMEQYKEAATMVGARRQQAGVGSISDYEKKIGSGIDAFRNKYTDLPEVFDQFIDEMEELGISAYDVVKSLESIKFENVYDVYRKVLKGKPLTGLGQFPGSKQNLRKFEQAVAQVEQLMPIIEKSKVKRGKHQEEVTTTLFQTSPIYKAPPSGGVPKELEFDANKQKNKILAINMNLRDMLKEYETLTGAGAEMTAQTAKRLERYTGPGGIPRGVKTISTLGPPEEQASRYREYRGGAFGQKARALAPLESTAIKLYTEKLLEQAPFGEFSRLGKQISYVNSAMSSLSTQAGKVFGVSGITTEEPRFRTTRERELTSAGRFGTTGYGFNVIAELKHSADTFEDQIVVSGNLAKALTQAVSTLVKPGPKGRLGSLGGAHVTDIEAGQVLKDVTPQAVENVSKQFMEILGVPQEYKKEANKALIESVQKEIIAVRGKDVEVQKAQLAEVFMNYFGRKFTTRYGSKGVSIAPEGREDLGVAKIPKSMGQLASDILGEIEKEGMAPKFGRLKDTAGMQKDLIESGNKFMISMFSDATSAVAKGLGVPEEIEKQAKIYKDFTAIIRKVYGEELPKDVEGITQLKGLYSKKVGGEFYEEKPIDIRISARGAIKRGLQPEFLETMMGNVIGAGAAETTVQPRLEKDVYEKILGTKKKAGLLSEYSKALGFESAGVSKKEIEAELFKTFKAAGKTDEEAKIMAERAAAVEEVANYYTTVKNEYGKATKSIVGPKFVQIIEEPHETEKWTGKKVRELQKGAKINVAAYSAYAGVFGEGSALIEQIKGGTTLESKRQFEYIKALEAMAEAGPGKEMADALIKGIKKVPLKELQAFEPRTGTFSEEDTERSLKGTILDIEKYASEFAVDLPTGKSPTGEIMRKPFYIPGPLARQTYPEELLAGEYGMDDISRYLQMVINIAKETEATLSGEGPQTKDAHNLIKTKVLETINKAQRGGTPEKTEIFKTFWEGLKDVEVDFAFREEARLPEGTTERQYIAKFFEDWKAKYTQKPDKTEDDALMLTIRRMADILVGSGPGARKDIAAAKPRLAKEVEAGTTADFAKRLGVDLSDDEEIAKKLNQLRKAKVTYMSALAESILGKSGAVQATFFERKAPAVIGKAITAVTDRTSELREFGDTLRQLATEAGFEKYVEEFGNIANIIDDIGAEHKNVISKYKKQGIPVLKQEELGVPEDIAKKIPVTFEKRYDIKEGTPQINIIDRNTDVESNLYQMLEYKKELEEGIKNVANKLDANSIKEFIDRELAPYVETLRFPFTGVSSLQPYKAKTLSKEEFPKGQFTYAVPGVPELRMATEEGKTGFVEAIKKLEDIRDGFVKIREELHTTSEAAGMEADPARVAALTNNIEKLDRAIMDVIPRYAAIQQKLDFDGDEIEAHSGVLAEARQDIKKHFDVLNKSTGSIETAWRSVRGFEETAPGSTSKRFPFADLLTYFESKWDPEKGYEFLKRPEVTEKLEFLKPAEKLDILSAAAKQPPHQLLQSIAEERITEPSGFKEIAEVIKGKGVDATSKELLEAIKMLDSDFSKLIEAGVNESLYQQKYADAIIGQLYKLHTGPETEAIYRMQRVAESRMGFGGGMVDPEAGGRTEAAGTFRRRWPTGLKMLGRLSPESEISTFMNELSRFAQQKGMDVKLAGEKPVGGEITTELAKGTEGVNRLLEKIGLAGDQADDDYSQLKQFADTSAVVIEKRLGELPTEAIRKEVSGLRKARGMPEITMGSRKQAVDEAVKLIGFEGFLRELAKQIEEDAVEALTAQLNAMPAPQRKKRMGRKSFMTTEEFAKEEIKTSPYIGMKAPGGISTAQIMSQRAPLYSFRSSAASQGKISEAFRKTGGEVRAPETLRALGDKGFTAKKYEQAQEVALSIARSLKEVGQQQAGGAYSDLVLSAIDNMYKEQEQKESKLNQLRQEGYDLGLKREVSDIPQRLFEEGMPDIPSFLRDLVNPANDAAGSLQRLKQEVDELSLLAGTPPLSAEARSQIKFGTPELGVAARAKYPEVAGESEDATAKREASIGKFTDLLIQKAQAVAQMDKAIAAIVSSKGFETKLLPPKEDIRRALEGEIKATIKAPIGRPTTVTTSSAKELRQDIEKAETMFYEETKKAARMPGGPTGPGGPGVGGVLTGRPSDEIVRVHIESVKAGIGLTFTPAGAMQDVIDVKKPGASSALDELRELQNRSAGVVKTVEETYENIYRASALSGGGIYGGKGSKADQQIEAIKEYMTTGKKEVPPKAESLAFEGTVIHKKEQDRLVRELEQQTGGKKTYDVERYVKYTSAIGKDITGHVDLVQQKFDEDTQKYIDEKVIDIKTVDENMVKRFKELGVKRFSDLGAIKEKGGLTQYDIQKLEEVASQLNLYIAAVATANNVAADSLKGEAWFYDRDDIKNIAKISFDFDPSMLKKDINAVAKARKSIVSDYGKESFAKATHVLDLEKADAKRRAGEEPLSSKEWKRFEELSKKHRAQVEDPSSDFWREKKVRPATLTKEKLRSDQIGQRARFEGYTIPEAPVMGEAVYDQLENLKRAHKAAKEYQLRSKGINMKTVGSDLHESLASIVGNVEEIGPQGQEFADAIEDLKFAGMIGGGEITKAWKYYRIALGDFFIKQAEEAKKLESELQEQGELGGARDAYQQAERTISEMKTRMSGALGKTSDIYTDMRRYISPDVMQQLGLYLTPEQLITKSKGALGDDDKLDKIFTKDIVGDVLEGGKLTAPIEKVREALKGISDLDEEMIKTLTDADKFKTVGTEIQEAWNFEKLTERVTKLRSALETFLRFRLQEDADVIGRKNLEDTLKLLRTLESQYSSFGRVQREGPAGWGEMGLAKVPRFIEPKQQLAMHQRNVQKVREYFKKTEEEGGPEAGERYTYMVKVIGEAGDTIKNVAFDFKKYGDALNFAGERTGVFSEAQRDIFKLMQEGGQTFRSAIMRAVRWGAASRIVYGGWQKLGESIGLLADIETGMANLRMIMSPLETDFDKMGKSAIGFAKQYGVPMTDVLKSMKVFAQQGLQQGEVIDRTETATLASNVTTLSASEATEALTAAMKVFRQEGEGAMKFMDAWSEVEAKHAITAGDMANALKKAASAGKNAGFTFDELNGIVAAVGSVTRQTGKEVGTAMRFIFRRLTSEKGPKELAKIGIPVLTDTGELRRGFDVLNELSMSWKDLTSAQRMNIAQAIGGTRQYNALLVLMDNWNEALSAIEDSTNSKGSAERRNLEVMKTFTKQMEQMKAAATEVYMAFGKITFPIAKTGLKGLKFLLEAFTEVPGVVKGALIAIAGFFIYMSKGAQIIDYFFERFRGGKSIIGEVIKGMSKEWTMGMSELFGTKELDDNLKTIRKKATIKIPTGIIDVSPEGVAQERFTEEMMPQGTKLKDFHSVLGKTVFLLKQTLMTYNEFIGDMVKGGGDILKDVGGPFDYLGKKLLDLNSYLKGSLKTLAPEALVGILTQGGPAGIISAIPAIVASVGVVATKAAGDTSKVVAKAASFAGDRFGEAGKSFVEGFASENTGMVKAMAPLIASSLALYPALKGLSEYYMKTTRSSQDYEKSMYGVRRATESQLKGIRDLMSSYTGLEGSMAEAVKVSDPDVKKRRQELGTFESPLLSMSSIIKKSRDLSNSLGDSNVNLVAGYDKFGNAILNITGNLKDYLKTLENIKVKESAKVEIDIAAKFITDLTEIEGPEKWKYALKNLLKEAPAFGEVLAKSIKISPAKAMDVVTERLNDMLALKRKFPMSTAFDKDIKKYQGNLKEVRSGFRTTYSDFRRVLSDIETKGLTKDDIAKLLGTEELRKGYELMIEVEPRFNLGETKGNVDWQDVLGAEVMKRAFPSFAATFDATAPLTKARLETAGAVMREGKAVSGDVAFFMDDAAEKYGIAGNQAIVSLKETTDGVFDWFLTYFNSKTLTIEERPFTEDLQNMVESIFPKGQIEEELSDRIKSLNEFVAGASAGLRGLSVKDFKKDFGLGERFFSDVPTTTILQGPKGFIPGGAGRAPAFGQSPFQKDWKDTTEEFFFKPMREYRLKASQLEKLQLEGLQGGEVTLAKGLYEELTKLQDVLKNNQVVLQYRAVFVDLTKTIEEGTRALKESLAVEQSRLKLRKGVAGYQKGVSEGLDAIDLGVQKFSDLTVKQRALSAGPEYGKAAVRFRELETKRGAREEQVYGVDRAMVALENINQVSKGFGAALSADDMKKYTEIVAKTDDTGAQSIAIETSKVVDNTASTVDRLDRILENMGDPGAIEESLKEMSPSNTVIKMERVAKFRDKNLETGNKDAVRSANKSLDLLTNSLVEQVGIKKALSMVDKSYYSLLPDRSFKPEELAQRAFGGADFKQFIAGMEENLPKQRSFFKRMLGMGEDLSGFKDEISPLTKLQEKNNKEQWISSKDLAKMSGAMTIWTGLNKHQSRDTITALEKQRQKYKPGTEERKDLETRIEKEKKGSVAEGKIGEETWKTAQELSALTTGATLFAKELGLAEGQIKKFTAAVAGLYGASKIIGKPEGKQAGGFITGPGGPRDDKININASAGEYIVNARSTKSVGKEILNYINKYGMLPGMQKGGIAPAPDKPFNLNSFEEKLKELQDKVILGGPSQVKIPGMQVGGVIIDFYKKFYGKIFDTVLDWGGVFGKEGSISDLTKGFKDKFGGKDNIPIRVSDGEYVVNPKSSKKLGYNKLDYINKYGMLPGFQAGGAVGAIPPSSAVGTDPTVNISNNSIIKLRNILLPYLAATATGYVAQRTEDDTRLATLNAQAKKEAELFVEIVEKYPKAAQKMIDARRQLVENVEKVTPVATTEQSLVLDSEKERKRIVKNLSKIREDIIEEHEKEVDEMANVANKLAKLEVAAKFKMEIEEMERIIREIDLSSAASQAIESSLISSDWLSPFGGGTLLRTVGEQWSGDIADILEDRMEDATDQLKYPRAGGMLAGRYKPQSIDYGIERISEMTPEQYLSSSKKRISYKPSLGQFFGEEVSGPQRGESGIITLIKDVFSGRTRGISKVRSAEDMLRNLENMQKKRDVKRDKLTEYIVRREDLQKRAGFFGGGLSETESEELDQLDNIIEDLGDSLVGLTDNIEKSKEALKTPIYEASDITRRNATAESALQDLSAFNVDRLLSNQSVLNRDLVGFAGGSELPMGRREMSTQQRMFADSSDKFKEVATEYSYRLNTLIPNMSQNIKELVQMRQEVDQDKEPERYESLTKEIDKATVAFDAMGESTRAMGEALSVANKFSEAMYKFKDAIEDIEVEESVQDLAGFKSYRESMDKLFGGSHPLAVQAVTPAEQRRGAMVGVGLPHLGEETTIRRKEEARLRYQLSQPGLKAKQIEGFQQQLADLPREEKLRMLTYERNQEQAQLQAQTAPFLELLRNIQKMIVAPEVDITPERREELIGIRDTLEATINNFGQEMTKQERKDELAKSEYLWDPAEYANAYKLIDEASEKQFKGPAPGAYAELVKSLGSEFQKMTQLDGPAKTASIFSDGFDRVVSAQEATTEQLKAMAEHFGVEYKDKDEGGIISKSVKWLRDLVGPTTIEKAVGGRVFGAGGPREDKVPAMLSSGEYVIRAASAKRLGYGTLEHMNKQGEVPGYADGGTPTEKELIAKKLMKKTDIGKKLSDRKKMLEQALNFADGGISPSKNLFLEMARSRGMPEEEITAELGGIEQPLIEPADIIGLGFGTSKLLFGLSKGIIKQVAKKPKTYEELLKTIVPEKTGIKGIVEKFRTDRAWKQFQKKAAKETPMSSEQQAMSELTSTSRKMLEQAKTPSANDILKVVETTKAPTNRAYELGKMMHENPAVRKTLKAAQKDFDAKTAAFGPIKELSDEAMQDYGVHAFKGQFFREAEEFAAALANPSAKSSAAAIAREFLSGSREIADFAFAKGGLVGYQDGGLQDDDKKTKFDDIISEASKKYGVDSDLIKKVIKQESDFNPLAESKVGAQGLMQLMPGTAKDLGVEDSFNPTQNIMAGTKYLKQQLDNFGGEISLALAAYNAGPTAVRRYGGIPPYKETQDYVKKILGADKITKTELAKAHRSTPYFKLAKAHTTLQDKEPAVSRIVEKELTMKAAHYTDEEKEKLFKGMGPKLPGGETFEKARASIAGDAFAEAKQRAAEASKYEFRPTVGETIRIKPGRAEDIKYRGYEIPEKTTRSAEVKVVKPGANEGADFYDLRKMQSKIKFLMENKEKAYKSEYVDPKGDDPEKRKAFDESLAYQFSEINALISHMQQTGKPLGSERAWDPEYKRYYFPEVEKYSNIKKNFKEALGIAPPPYHVYDSIKTAKRFDAISAIPGLRGIPAYGFPSEQHSKILKLIKEGKTEEARAEYDETLKQTEAFKSSLSPKKLDIFKQMSEGFKRGRLADSLLELRKHTELSRKEMLAKATGESDPVLDLLRTLFPGLHSERALKRKLSSMSEEEMLAFVNKQKVTGESKHHGGEIRKTGHVFMQKGEMVYPKGYAEGGPVYGELAKEATTKSLNGSMEIKIDSSALNDAVKRLESIELKVEDKTLELPDFPKLEVNTDNVNIVVDGDSAAAKIQAAVENITVDVNSTGAVGAEELKNISEQLENRINSLNLNMEGMQNELSIITTGGEAIDVPNLISTKVNEYTSDVDRKINDIRSEVSNLESRVSQNQNMSNVTTTELDRKIMHLQNLTGRGTV